jgi:hypothetical protein
LRSVPFSSTRLHDSSHNYIRLSMAPAMH